MSVLSAVKWGIFTGLTALVIVCSSAALMAQPFETKAKAAFVIDHTTGTVLLSKNADRPLPPASMSKLMTTYMAFEAVRDGRLRLEERLPVSDHAASYGGSSMFLDASDRVLVEDLLRGVIVLSGNDASAVLAEALSPDGTEAGFARMMTRRAKQLGMRSSTFANSNGWPAIGHRMSMRDLSTLTQRLLIDFPTYYPLFSEEKFVFDGRVPANTQNRNPLLGLGLGADGLKTGHTQEAGYGLVGSAQQGSRRIIFVITGLESAKARAEEAERIVNWAFRQFALKDVFRKGQKVTTASVWMGNQLQVGLVMDADMTLLLPVFASETPYEAQAVFDQPIPAPITQGQKLGSVQILREGDVVFEAGLLAEKAVELGGFETRLQTAARLLWANFQPALSGLVAQE